MINALLVGARSRGSTPQATLTSGLIRSGRRHCKISASLGHYLRIPDVLDVSLADVPDVFFAVSSCETKLMRAPKVAAFTFCVSGLTLAKCSSGFLQLLHSTVVGLLLFLLPLTMLA